MKKIVFLLQAFMLTVAIHSNLLAKDTYILFTGTMLNPLSNKSYANRYFLKYKQRWQRMRQLLNKIKNKEI